MNLVQSVAQIGVGDLGPDNRAANYVAAASHVMILTNLGFRAHTVQQDQDRRHVVRITLYLKYLCLKNLMKYIIFRR